MKTRDRNLVDLAYSQIKGLLFRGQFYPGQKIVVDDLAKALAVSRTPVREALNRLAQDRFLTQRSQRGFYVSELGKQEASDLFDLREALEELSVIGAVEQTDKRVLARIRRDTRQFGRAVERNLNHERITLNMRFHLAIAGLGGNEELRKTLARVLERLLFKREFGGFYISRGMSAFEEHLAILDALSARDRDKAVHEMRTHISRGKATLLAQIDQQQEVFQSVGTAQG